MKCNPILSIAILKTNFSSYRFCPEKLHRIVNRQNVDHKEIFILKLILLLPEKTARDFDAKLTVVFSVGSFLGNIHGSVNKLKCSSPKYF